MKAIKSKLAGLCLLLISLNSFGQRLDTAKTVLIVPYHLSISYAKTTSLVFPFAVRSVDRGSRDVLAQKATGFDNVLQVKAGRKGFDETNLTVITEDGHLYACILDYSDNPSALSVSFPKTTSKPGMALLTGKPNQAVMECMAEKVAGERETLNIRDKREGMKLRLAGLYIQGDVFYYQFTLQNKSTISYGIDQFRFYIRDQKRVKRTASQELELKPLYIKGDTSVVNGHTKNILVFALDKFTIPEKKYLSVEVMEKNGGRHLQLQVGNKELMQAASL